MVLLRRTGAAPQAAARRALIERVSGGAMAAAGAGHRRPAPEARGRWTMPDGVHVHRSIDLGNRGQGGAGNEVKAACGWGSVECNDANPAASCRGCRTQSARTSRLPHDDCVLRTDCTP